MLKTILKHCKYCPTPLENGRSNQTMCKRCKLLHRIEYDRVYKLMQRQGIEINGDTWRFRPHTCPFCDNFIIGRRYCKDCRDKRELICDTIIKELTEVKR